MLGARIGPPSARSGLRGIRRGTPDAGRNPKTSSRVSQTTRRRASFVSPPRAFAVQQASCTVRPSVNVRRTDRWCSKANRPGVVYAGHCAPDGLMADFFCSTEGQHSICRRCRACQQLMVGRSKSLGQPRQRSPLTANAPNYAFLPFTHMDFVSIPITWVMESPAAAQASCISETLIGTPLQLFSFPNLR